MFTLFLFTYKDAASAGLRYDLQNGPWPCSCPQGCVYNNGSNAEHILITKEDISAGLGKRLYISVFFLYQFQSLEIPFVVTIKNQNGETQDLDLFLHAHTSF